MDAAFYAVVLPIFFLHSTLLRTEYLKEAFKASIRAAESKYMQLAARVAGGDADTKLARDTARKRVDELKVRQQQKLDELAHLRVVRAGSIIYQGTALVVPAPVDPRVAERLREEDELDLGGLKRDEVIEQRAMEYVMTHERARGWEPEDVSRLHDGSGFDIRSVGPADAQGQRPVRRIEVKGRAGPHEAILLTPNEWLQARRHGSSYWLYVVWGCRIPGQEQLLKIPDPALRLAGRAQQLTVVKGYHIPAEAIAEANEPVIDQ